MNVNRFLVFILLLPPFFLYPADKDARFDRMILEAAPPEVQYLPNMLNDSKERDDYGYSCMAMVGKPGVGKTSMAYAVARKAGWEPYYIHQGHLSDKYRNSSSKKLQEMLEEVVLSGEKTLIIFDEFNSLLENYDSSNHDTDTLSRTAWCFLDEQYKNKNYDVFAIATMNRIYKIPEEFKTRLFPAVERITEFKDKKQIQESFLLSLESSNISFSEESKAYLDKRFDDLNITDLRMIASCASIVKTYALARIKERPATITKEYVDGAIEKYKFNFDLMEFGYKNISDEERRFQASQELQWKQFKMNFGMSVLGFTTQTGLAVWQAYNNQQQFAESAKWHMAGLGLNILQAYNSKKQFDLSMEFQRHQFDASQANAKESADMQRQGLVLQGAGYNEQVQRNRTNPSQRVYDSRNPSSIKTSVESIMPQVKKQADSLK